MRSCLVLALLLAVGCKDSTGSDSGPASVVVSPARDTLDFEGDTVQLSARVLDGKGRVVPDVPVTWRVEGSSVRVSINGLVTARSDGPSRVSARTEDLIGTAEIEVRPPVSVTIASGTQTGSATRQVSLDLRNGGGKGVVELEFWSLRAVATGRHRSWGAVNVGDIAPNQARTVQFPVATGGDPVDWVIIRTRQPNDVSTKVTGCFRLTLPQTSPCPPD